MSVAITVETRDNATPALRTFMDGLSPAGMLKLAKNVGNAERKLLVNHFKALDSSRANTLGGRRTHFYADAAKSINITPTEQDVTIRVAKQGILQRLYGGTINARNVKWLTIPASPVSYAKSAREFNNLRFIPLGANLAMLIEPKAKGQKSIGKPDVFYWLKKSVNQEADSSVIPTKEEFQETASNEITAYLNLLQKRAEKQ